MANSVNYTPPLSAEAYLRSQAFISLIVGPIGSTKTSASIMKIAYQAAQMAKCRDGIRRSRAIWVRNTREQLRDTSIPDFLKWFPDGVAGVYEKTNYKFVLKFDDVECEVLFRGLDDTNDVRRLLSLQASFAIMDEFREIHKDIFEAIQGRLGRYPDMMLVPHRPEWGMNSKGDPIGGCVKDDGSSNKHIWAASNPPDMDTFWEEFLSDPPANAAVFFQPSGLSQEADWLKYLPSDYYDNLAEGKTQDWIDVYINAQFGKSLSGQPVHRSFKLDYHVAKEPLRPIRMSMLIIGMDFGLNPSATINQLDPMGRYLTFDALTSEGMGLEQFLSQKLKPLLASKYIGMKAVFVGDPAGSQRAQTDARSCFDVLKANGFNVVPARTNNIVARINAVDKLLAKQVDGKAGWTIDPESCVPLVRAMRGGYRYKIKKNGESEDSPEKNNLSHIADAMQYAALYADGGTAAGWMTPARREVREISHAGWT
jgi:hypothetical protein